MVRAERCPNCSAFLPVRRPGVRVRTCEFCGIEVPGHSPTVEVEAYTPSTFVPPPPRPTPESAEERARRQAAMEAAARRGRRIALVIGLGVAGVVVGGALMSYRAAQRRMAPVRAAQSERDKVAREAAAAVEAAGGWKRFDGLAYLDHVEKLARSLHPDAGLTALQLYYVGPDGRGDHTLGDSATYYQFRSPANSKAPPGTPQGADVKVSCEQHFNAGPKFTQYPPSSHETTPRDCQAQLLERPSCSAAEIWKRALAAGAPNDAVATLRYAEKHRSNWTEPGEAPDKPQRGEWHFSIQEDVGRKSFHKSFADDCDQPPPPPREDAPVTDAPARPRRPGALPDAPAPPDAVIKALATISRTRALNACFAKATKGHDSIEAIDLLWTFDVDEQHLAKLRTTQASPDIEGIFQGSLAKISKAFVDCSLPSIGTVRFKEQPSGELKVRARLTREGELEIPPRTY